MYRKYVGATGYDTGRLSRKRLMMINPNGLLVLQPRDNES